jgi:hypothetical protein
MRLKSLVCALASLLPLGSLSSGAYATTYEATGTVAILRSHDTAVSEDWFQLTGATSLGNCPTYQGLVLIVLKDDDRAWRHFAMLLSAKRSATSISAWVDDTVLNSSGYCTLQYMQE